LRLEAEFGDDRERVAIRKGLTFGRALQAHLRLPLVAERGQPMSTASENLALAHIS
jgi:bifunctional pyridoxal-dependent enzyme with beta-cystathionase and maltose regulon repressor activities